MMTLEVLEELNKKGFVDEHIDPTLDLFDEIERLKKKLIRRSKASRRVVAPQNGNVILTQSDIR